MSFGNGPAKGNGRGPVRGKSIRGHMADAIILGLTAKGAAEYVQMKCCTARISRKRLLEIHADMLLPNAPAHLPPASGGKVPPVVGPDLKGETR